jgi:hypothetical protein
MLTYLSIKCNVLNGKAKTMIEPEQLKVGLLVWWKFRGCNSAWDCPAVVTKVDTRKNHFRIKSFDNMKETGDLFINRPPGPGWDRLALMKITTEKEVLAYLSEKENSFKYRIVKIQKDLDKLRDEADQYSKNANILREELTAKAPKGILPK